MPRFRFQFEPVLTQRQRTEERLQLAVADLERQRIEIEGAIRRCQQQIAHERAELRLHLGEPEHPGHGAVALREARLQAAVAFSIDARARQEVIRLAGLHKRLDAARSDLLRATTDRKAVELLRARRMEAWRLEQSRVESAAVDELSVMRASRSDETEPG